MPKDIFGINMFTGSGVKNPGCMIWLSSKPVIEQYIGAYHHEYFTYINQDS